MMDITKDVKFFPLKLNSNTIELGLPNITLFKNNSRSAYCYHSVKNYIYVYGPAQYFLLYPILLSAKTNNDLQYQLAIFYYFIILGTSLLLYFALFDKIKKFEFMMFYSIFFSWTYLYDCLYQKNIELFEVFLISLSLFFVKKLRPNYHRFLAPLALLISIFCKVKTLLFFPYYLIKKDYKMSIIFGLLLVCAFIITDHTIEIENVKVFKMLKSTKISTSGGVGSAESSLRIAIQRGKKQVVY